MFVRFAELNKTEAEKDYPGVRNNTTYREGPARNKTLVVKIAKGSKPQ